MEQPQSTNKADGDVPDVARVVRPCKACGSVRYEIHHLYTGYRERLLIVQCGDCKEKIIPVVVDYFMPESELYSTCKAAWNSAQLSINHKP